MVPPCEFKEIVHFSRVTFFIWNGWSHVVTTYNSGDVLFLFKRASKQ